MGHAHVANVGEVERRGNKAVDPTFNGMIAKDFIFHKRSLCLVLGAQSNV